MTHQPNHNSQLWLTFMSIIGVLNLIAILYICFTVGMTEMSLCGLLYISSTTFRSLLIQNVTNRTTLRTCSPFSTAFNDRFIATIGELSFTYQLVLYFDMPFAMWHMIVVAQIVCWIAVLTGYPILHAIENSLWGVLSCSVFFHTEEIIIQTACTLFCAYILFGDIPMYLRKKNIPKSVVVSLKEITSISVVDESWEFWKGECLWMTGYFTFGAWGSMLLSTK